MHGMVFFLRKTTATLRLPELYCIKETKLQSNLQGAHAGSGEKEREEPKLPKAKNWITQEKKLFQATSFSLSSGDEHLLNQRERSSLQRLEIIKLVSSSCRKTLAFLHFQIFHKTGDDCTADLGVVFWKGIYRPKLIRSEGSRKRRNVYSDEGLETTTAGTSNESMEVIFF